MSQQTLLSGEASPSKIPVPNSRGLSASKIPLRNVQIKCGAGCKEAKPFPVCKKCCCDPPCHDMCEKYKCKKKKNDLCEKCDCEFMCFKECEAGKNRRKKAICAECTCNEGDCTACCQKKKDCVASKKPISADKMTGGDEVGGEEPSETPEPGGGELGSAVEGDGVVPTDTARADEADGGNAITEIQDITESSEQDQAESAMETLPTEAQEKDIEDKLNAGLEDDKQVVMFTEEATPQNLVLQEQVVSSTTDGDEHEEMVQDQIISSTEDECISSTDDNKGKTVPTNDETLPPILEEDSNLSPPTEHLLEKTIAVDGVEITTTELTDEELHNLPPYLQKEVEEAMGETTQETDVSSPTEHLLQKVITVDGAEIGATELTDEELHNLPPDLQKGVEEAMGETAQETEISPPTEHVLQKMITVDGVEIGATELTDEELHNLPPDLQKGVEEAMGETTQETEISPLTEHLLQKTITVDGVEIGATELTEEELHNLPPDLQKGVEEAMGETTENTDHLLQEIIKVDGVQIGVIDLTEKELQNLPLGVQKQVGDAMDETTQKTVTVGCVEVNVAELTDEELHKGPADIQEQVNAMVIVEGAEAGKQIDDVNIDAGDQQLIADTEKGGLAEVCKKSAACVCNELTCQETCVGIKTCKESPCMDCSCIVDICRRICKEFLEANNIPITNPLGTLTEGGTTKINPDLNEDNGQDKCEMQEGDELEETCSCSEDDNVGPLEAKQQEPSSCQNEDSGAGDEQIASCNNEQNPPDDGEQINADNNEEFSDAVEQIDAPNEQNTSGGVEDQPPTCAIVKCCTLPTCMATNEAQVQTPPPQADASCDCQINKPSQDMVTCVPSCISKSTNFMSNPSQTQSSQIQTPSNRDTCKKTARPSKKRKMKPCYCEEDESDATISDGCTSSCAELMRHDMTDCDCAKPAKPQKKGAGAKELDMLVRQINCGCCHFNEQRGGTYAKELDDVVTQIQTSCINAESMMSPFVKSIFQPTLSALGSTVSKVRARSRQQLVAADTNQFGGGSSKDQDASRIEKPSSTVKQDHCPTCTGLSPNPTPLMVSCIRRLGPASLIVNWEASQDQRIVGYEVTVNGKIKARVLDRLRTSALLDTLDLRRALTISVFAFSKKGRCEPPAQATFNGRAGECTNF